MKWCMVAAMAVSFLCGSMAFAQEDNLDLDALLGDVGAPTEQAAEAAAPAVDAEAAPAAAVPAEAVAAPAEEAVEAVAEETVADPFAGLEAAPAEETAALAAEAAAPAPVADLLGDLFT